ncbi:hypothetical protein BKA65DRAFT_250274 [Rhexocercosporidium sp. MPI-PUGE-AT-0058]|nr:hypothetical protein BKA65DRAFT_250274 [Rhexocercosporidium sp. MPI-PUGE-AT-0058]
MTDAGHTPRPASLTESDALDVNDLPMRRYTSTSAAENDNNSQTIDQNIKLTQLNLNTQPQLDEEPKAEIQSDINRPPDHGIPPAQPEECHCAIPHNKGDPGLLIWPGSPIGFPELDWKPPLLRIPLLIAAALYNAACLAGLCYFGYKTWSGQDLHVKGQYNYFTLRYLPTTVGVITALWTNAILTNLLWMMPYITMSQVKYYTTNNTPLYPNTMATIFAPYTVGGPHNFGGYSLIVGGNRHYLLFATLLQGLITQLILPPVKANLFKTHLDEAGWIIQISSWTCIVLIIIYLCQFLLMMSLLFGLPRDSFGLSDSVASIADQINLFAKSNIMEDFQGIETLPWRQWPKQLSMRTYRLGYWRAGCNGKFWYGIGKLEDTRAPGIQENPGATRSTEHPGGEDALTRYRFSNVFLNLHPVSLFVWLCLTCAFIGLNIFLLVMHQRNRSFRINSTSVESSNVYLRILPTLIATIYNFFWGTVAKFFLLRQPFAGMFKAKPVEQNLLLEYAYDLPLILTLKALSNGHIKVAWLSFIQLASALHPIFLGALFAVNSPISNQANVTISGTAAIGSLVFFILYSLSIPVAWPTPKRRLPCPLRSLGETIGLCYSSKLLESPAFDFPEATDLRIHRHCRIILQKDEYALGVYTGTDGQEHMGFDIAYLDKGRGFREKQVRIIKPEKRPKGMTRRWVDFGLDACLDCFCGCLRRIICMCASRGNIGGSGGF